MTRSTQWRRDERGVILILALIAMFALSLLALIMMMTINTETKLSGTNMRTTGALTLAEIGRAHV